MRPRPRPNRRRGLLRAGIAIVILVALLVGAMLVLSSLLAPKVQAPTVPTTPGPITPITTPGRSLTPAATPRPSGPSRARPTVGPTSVRTGVKDIALVPARVEAKQRPHEILRGLRLSRPGLKLEARFVAVFAGIGDAYQGRTLIVRDRLRPGAARVVGRADPFIQPVWSPGRRSLYFVRVRQVSGIPGAEWALWRWDRGSGALHPLTVARAMVMIPLGVTGGHFLYVLSRAADSVVNVIEAGKPKYMETLISQPVSSAFLAPNGSGIAFAAPSSCGYCTVDIYDLRNFWIWYGPTGAPSDLDIAWFADGTGLVTYRGGQLVTVTNEASVSGIYSVPKKLPRRWVTPLRAAVVGSTLRLTNLITGQVYLAYQVGEG